MLRDKSREVFMNIISKSIIVLASIAGLVAASTPAAHATNMPTCVDGNVRSNLVVTWKSNSSVTVGTVGNKPVCNDTTVLFSSYTMPDNYNGKPFTNNPTASPQSVFDTTTAVIKKGTSQAVAMTIDLPDACKNIQVDTYYGPEIKVVGPKGHANQYISGKIVVKSKNSCTPATPEEPTPEVPTPEAQTPETPAPEVVITPEMPAELPETGNGFAATAAISTVLSATTYAAVYLISKRRQ
jgi:hypothetical protein